MEDPKTVDLPPHEWRSEREKPKEPFWGPGLPFLFAIIGAVIVGVILHDSGWTGRLTAAGVGIILFSIAQAIFETRPPPRA